MMAEAKILTTTTTAAAVGTVPLTNEQRLIALEGELAKAKAELEDWSALLKKAILEKAPDKEIERCENQQKIYLERVKDLEGQIAVLRRDSQANSPGGSSRKRVLAPVQDNDTSMNRCMKKALPTLSGLLGSFLALDPNSSLEDRVMELGTKLNDDPNNTEKILFRTCYYNGIFNHLLPYIEQNAAVLVGGAPGIGKSVLGMLVSVLLVFVHHRVVLFEHYGARILLASPGCDKDAIDSVRATLRELRFDIDEFDVERNNVFKVLDDQLFKELRGKETIVFIQDVGDSGAEVVPISGKPFVLITSPNTERIKQASRERKFKRVFLPPWTLEELQAASEQCFHGKFTPEQVEQRYLKFGGAIRSVLDIHNGAAEETADEAYEKALNGCTFESLSETFRSKYEELKKGPISAMLIHAIPVMPGAGGVSSKSQNKFASKSTKEKLMERFLEATTLKAAEFTNAVRDVPELAEFVGRYLESNFHRSVSKGSFDIRSLARVNSQFQEIRLPVMIRVRFTREDFKDVTSVLPDHYYQPSRPKFPTLDSFALLPAALFLGPKARGNVLVIFQVTKSPEHKLNGVIVKRLQDRLKVLNVGFVKTLFLWVSSEGGILSEQPVQNGDGKDYDKGEPNMEQWLLAFGKEYNELFAHVLGLQSA